MENPDYTAVSSDNKQSTATRKRRI